jgi:hypothetical protein
VAGTKIGSEKLRIMKIRAENKLRDFY